MSRCQQDHLVHKDRRLQKIVEILNHLKIIKFHVWENTFEESVKDLRAEELESLREFLLLQAFQVRMSSIILHFLPDISLYKSYKEAFKSPYNYSPLT